MRIYLIRHGETVNNVAHVLDTDEPGADLSGLGRDQARGIVGRLEGVPIEAIYVSNLVRTHQTAAPLAAERGLAPIADERLREIQAGEYEGQGSDAAYSGYLGTLDRWVRGELDLPMGGGVTGYDVLARFDAAVADICAAGWESVAVVSHGGMIGVWSALRARGHRPGTTLGGNHLRNTEMSIVEGNVEEGFEALSWNGARVGT